MKEKVKCKKCGLLIDKDQNICPYCGFAQDSIKEEKVEKQDVVFKKERKPLEVLDGTRCYFLQTYRHLILFLLGTILLTIVQLFAQLILQVIYSKEFLETIDGLASLNAISYSVLFIIMILFLYKDFKQIYKLTPPKTINLTPGLIGVGILIVFSVLYSYFSTNLGANISNNQSYTIQIIRKFPSIGLIILGFVGPIVEEFTYRLGLFSGLRKYNRLSAYLVTAIIFGLIHFNVSSISNSKELISELINFPSYAISGAILCYIYEKYGLENSILAHVLNNLFSVIQIMCM